MKSRVGRKGVCRVPPVGSAPKAVGAAKFAPNPSVLVLSDSTGNLARHMLAAVLTQFPGENIDVRFDTFVRDQARLDAALDQAQSMRAIVCHAIISPALKRHLARRCQKAGICCYDLTGGLVDFLSRGTGLSPRNDREALHRLDAAYTRRIDAMEFALNHDDGLGLATLGEADIVLSGVSRTSKTPTSIYLAQQGYKTANVALALGIDPPPELLALPRGRVVGLSIDPDRLEIIRRHRDTGWRGGIHNYVSHEHIHREVLWSKRLFTAQGWPALDVTNQAIEETAWRVLQALGMAASPVHQGTATEG